MKQHGSVFMLMARSSLYRVLAVLTAMALAQMGLFLFAMQRLANARIDVDEMYSGGVDRALWPGHVLEEVLDYSKVHWVLGAAFILLTVVLCLTGCERSSKVGYTLRRLSISERWVFLWQGAYHACCYFLLWAVEALVMLGLCQLYVSMSDPALVNGQSIFLAFYRSALLHSLLPLADIERWVINVLLVLCLGLTTAAFPVHQREGERGMSAVVLVGVVLWGFCRELGGYVVDAVLILLALVCAAQSVIYVFSGEGEANEA